MTRAEMLFETDRALSEALRALRAGRDALYRARSAMIGLGLKGERVYQLLFSESDKLIDTYVSLGEIREEARKRAEEELRRRVPA